MTRMHTLAFVAAVLLAASAGAQAQSQSKKLYCWNENGNRICGDRLPADAADNARTEFNARTGMQTREVARALTEEERGAAEAAAAEAQHQAELDAARQRREMAMVESYDTEDDLRRAYQNRSALMDDTIKASRLAIGNLRQSLLGQLRRASELELGGKPVGQALAANIQTQHDAMRRQQGILAQQQLDRVTLDAELAAALTRYRELTAPEGEAAEAPAPAVESG